MLTRILREPTTHFVILAAIIFLVYGLSQSSNEQVIEIAQQEIDARLFMQELAAGQELDPEQREALTRAFIEEQILVTEAMAMGLDNDARIHDMLAQKMRHVLSGDIIQPSEAELQTYYDANQERYRSPPVVSVLELVLNSTEPLPAAVTDALSNNASVDELLALVPGTSSRLPNVNHLDLSNIFSEEFANQVFAATDNSWVGPFTSNRGQHWLNIEQRRDARTPAMSEIADRVRLDWITEEEDLRLADEVAALWDKYSIRITASAETE